MSFVGRQPVTAPRRRSSSAVRTGSYNSRPRSLGSYTSNASPYSSPYSSSSNSYSALSKYDNFGVNYQSPYFPNTYRGSATASLTIPAKAFAGNGEGHRSRKQSNGYSREPSLSRSRSSLCSSGMGSRSMSLTSLQSEGYAVSGV